jgi:hypothetical protein
MRLSRFGLTILCTLDVKHGRYHPGAFQAQDGRTAPPYLLEPGR